MNTEISRELEAQMAPVGTAELNDIEGGVAPMWTEDGRMVTCTDPLRWRSPGTLYPYPTRFPML
jgi:hypothetical protein